MHNPIIQALKKIVEEHKNEIFYSKTICSSYLPNWRKDQDYRKSYSSKTAEGGGVLLDLSHELDYNQWLFGNITSINGIYGEISDLEINSEDFCDLNLSFENNMIASIHLDYFSKYTIRKIYIFTKNIVIIGDFVYK